MPPTLKFRNVQIDASKLTVGLFRQLPIEALCDATGKQRPELAPFGVVRYKHGIHTLWALAVRGEQVVRCALDPTLRSRKELEESLAFWVNSAQAPHNREKGEDSFAYREAERQRLLMAAEPGRFNAHSAAAQLEQVFL